MHILWRAAILSLFTYSPSFAAVYTDFAQLPAKTYDYIVIGAGTAGNVLANRLTEDPMVNVLVLEAGGSDEGVLLSIIPFLATSATPNTPFDWNYTVAPQEALDSRVFAYNRGKIVGGSSSINGLFHHYGSSDDYDKLANITGDPGWSWQKMKKYVYKHEIFNPGLNSTRKYIARKHGTDGMTSIGLPTYPWKIDDLVLAATKELPDDFPFNQDNSGGDNVLGVGWVESSIKDGKRSSSSTSYLRDAINRPNLAVLIQHQAMKLIRSAVRGNLTSGSKPTFSGVSLSIGPGAPVYQVEARREIILSAGAIGTPQLLLLSGVGTKAELEVHGIKPLLELPVGQNLVDHPMSFVTFTAAQSLDTLDPLFTDPAARQAALDRWMVTHDGPFANTLGNQLGFLRLPHNASIFDSEADPASGPKAGHWEMIFNNFWMGGGPNQSFITSYVALVAPSSRGFVKLATSNPFDKPIIDPKFLTTPFDKFAIREAFRGVKRFFRAKAFSGYVLAPYGSSNAETDEEIDELMRQTVSTAAHTVGTSAMSDDHTGSGVVDSKLRVKGANGLRIVDASVWPFVPCAHTQGPTYLIAERAADIIKEEYKSWTG
ncbi:hypothetical protein CPB83DRAFT_900034 [Crepidotus variabilis]|uniref:pyranose dehydrogenase (acceptor) n=1 Tax=Crepidotus variabilis TaxID=179855 RepID=A0A9P6JIE4_9AGAR|nr:hypothetical protein CPB83DRAFT_900034 [Crepidotus variabilis]